MRTQPDPVVGGPFDYVAFEGGSELRSKWIPDEKLRSKRNLGPPEPLLLLVGRRGK